MALSSAYTRPLRQVLLNLAWWFSLILLTGSQMKEGHWKCRSPLEPIPSQHNVKEKWSRATSYRLLSVAVVVWWNSAWYKETNLTQGSQWKHSLSRDKCDDLNVWGFLYLVSQFLIFKEMICFSHVIHASQSQLFISFFSTNRLAMPTHSQSHAHKHSLWIKLIKWFIVVHPHQCSVPMQISPPPPQLTPLRSAFSHW